jgi:hypothetical protein
MRKLISAFLAGLIVMAGLGYWWVRSKAQGDEPGPAVQRGPVTRTETIAVGEIVNDIKALNQLVIFRAYVTAETTTHEIGWFTQSDQTMITPAFVNYYINMSDLKPDMVSVDGKTITVHRPQINIERPNIDTRNIRVYSDGVFTYLSSTTERMRVSNSDMALRQLNKRAAMPFLFDAAKSAANAAVAANIRTALAAKGHRDIEIQVIR